MEPEILGTCDKTLFNAKSNIFGWTGKMRIRYECSTVKFYVACFQNPRKVGRPKGARDCKPRIARMNRKQDIIFTEGNRTPEPNGQSALVTKSMTAGNDSSYLEDSICLDDNFVFRLPSFEKGKYPSSTVATEEVDWMEGIVLTNESPDPFHEDWPYWT